MPIPSDFKDLLEAKGFAHMATIGPDGAPQNTVVWYDNDGDDVLVSITKSRQKYENLERDPRVSLSITDPENPYRRVEIRGEASTVDDPEKELIDQLAQKYLGQDQYPWNQPGDERVKVRISPTHVTTFKG